MRKLLPGLSVAAVAFLCGVSAVAIFNFKKEMVSEPLPREKSLVESSPIKVEFLAAPSGVAEDYRLDAPWDEKVFSGLYRLENFGEMSEVYTVILTRSYGYHEHSDKLFSQGGVMTNTGEDRVKELFWGRPVTIENNQVRFRTAKIRGIQYRFEGFFLTDKTTGADGEKLLHGTLEKFEKGKKVAEIGGDFAFYAPRCCIKLK